MGQQVQSITQTGGEIAVEGNNTLKVLAPISEHTCEEDEVEVLGEIDRTLEVDKCAEVSILVKGDEVTENGVKQALTLVGEKHNEV